MPWCLVCSWAQNIPYIKQLSIISSWLTSLTSKNIPHYISNKKTERRNGKRLQLKKWCVFFSLKVLICHVLFKLSSAGTLICTYPWGPIALCLPSSTQPASYSSITCSSIHPSSPPIHSSMEDREGTEGTKWMRRRFGGEQRKQAERRFGRGGQTRRLEERKKRKRRGSCDERKRSKRRVLSRRDNVTLW